MRKWGRLLVLLGAGLILLWDGLGEPARPSAMPAMTEPVIADDVVQVRLNDVLPTPRGAWRLQQTFTPRHDGLREIEIILARNGAPQPGEDGRLTLSLLDETGNLIAERTLLTVNFAHNHTYTFPFPVQTQSAGRSYTLQFSGNAANPLTVWGYTLDVHDGGEMTLLAEDGQPLNERPLIQRPLLDTAVQELRFITRYQLTSGAAFTRLARIMAQEGGWLLLALVFLPLPGLWLMGLRPWRERNWDGAAWLGMALALGTAVWPLLWYAVSALGGRFTSELLWLLVRGGYAGLVAWWVWQRWQGNAARPWPVLQWRWEHALLLGLLALGLAVRLLAVRDLPAPPWVDSSRHALITAVMVADGQAITDYAPYLPIDHFPYHFGFHTLSASLMLMAGGPLPRLLLWLGQLLNGLLPLTVYTAVWLLTRRRPAALLSALLVGLPFFFPAYYATWGRLTQLTAVLVLPLLLALTWLLVAGGRRWPRGWWAIALLAAALFLIHFRVFLFYLPFAAVVWLLHKGRHGRWLALSAVAAVALVLPRALTLNAVTAPAAALATNIADYNAFPTAYYLSGWDRFFIWLAAPALLWVLMALLWRRRWTWLPLALALWVGLLFLLLGGEVVGLPTTAVVNLNSMYITLFLPLAIFLSAVCDRFWRWLRQSHWLWLALGYVGVGVVVTAVTLFGIQQQIDILNPETVLVRPPDLPALAWLDENLPPAAVVAVNSWKWLGETWAGSDGGAWLVPLTGRSSTTPPADYIYSRELYEWVNPFNEAATAVSDWTAPENAEWLRRQGVTHIFVGARGGFFDPAALAQNPQLELIYQQDGVFIFALTTGRSRDLP